MCSNHTKYTNGRGWISTSGCLILHSVAEQNGVSIPEKEGTTRVALPSPGEHSSPGLGFGVSLLTVFVTKTASDVRNPRSLFGHLGA